MKLPWRKRWLVGFDLGGNTLYGWVMMRTIYCTLIYVCGAVGSSRMRLMPAECGVSCSMIIRYI